MTVTLQDMRRKLGNRADADPIIFWFCLQWHSGPRSDLYRVMCQCDFSPRWLNPKDHFVAVAHDLRGEPIMEPARDATGRPLFENGVPVMKPKIELQQGYMLAWLQLGELLVEAGLHPAHGEPPEYPLRAIRFDDVKENDVIIHTTPKTFPCIEQGWPCRVYTHHGALGVACAESKAGQQFHPLERDERGNVKGFQR